MNINRILGVIVIIILIALGVYFFLRDPVSSDSETVKVAAILNLSGDAAKFDAIKKNTLLVANKRIDSLFPDNKIELRFFDAGSNTAVTKSAITNAISWGADFYLSGTSPNALAIADQIRPLQPVKVHFANAANPDFGPPRIGEYRMWPDWKQETNLIYSLIDSLKIRSILMIYSSDPYSTSLSNELKLYENKSGLALSEFMFDPSTSPDFRASLIRAKDNNVDAIIIFGLPPGINSFVSQLTDVEWHKPVIGGVNINLNLNSIKSSGIKAPFWSIKTEAMKEKLDSHSEAMIYRDLYISEYNEKPPFHALYLADALYFIANATQDVHKDSYYENVKLVTKFDAPSGVIVVNEDGTLEFEMETNLLYE